jgi:hypothetical protein
MCFFREQHSKHSIRQALFACPGKTLHSPVQNGLITPSARFFQAKTNKLRFPTEYKIGFGFFKFLLAPSSKKQRISTGFLFACLPPSSHFFFLAF